MALFSHQSGPIKVKAMVIFVYIAPRAQSCHRKNTGDWFRGITSDSHSEGHGFNSRILHLLAKTMDIPLWQSDDKTEKGWEGKYDQWLSVAMEQ